MLRKLFFSYLVILSCVGGRFSYAQLDNSIFYDIYPLGEQYSKNLYLNLDVFGYLKNNEYYGYIANGYSRFGYQIRPELSYYPLSNLRLSLGGFFQREFGDEGFSQIMPTFSIKYQIDSLKIVFGTLEGTLTHQLVEPMFDFEKVMDDRIEEGVQIRWNKYWIDFELWLDWQNTIKYGEEDQEELVFGVFLKPNIYHGNRSNVALIGQTTLKHLGGQGMNTGKEEVIVASNSIGIEYKKDFEENSLVKYFKTQNHFLYSHWSENAYSLDFGNGYGVFLNCEIGIKGLSIMGSYWYGYDYFSPVGGQLYQAIGTDYPETGYVETKREVAFIRFLWHREFKGGISLGCRFEPHYETRNGFFDHSEAFYIRYKGDFRLLSIGK